MKKAIKRTLLALLAIVVLGVVAFFGLYFTRIQSYSSIEQLTDYEDGYNLYRMDIKYNYDLDKICRLYDCKNCKNRKRRKTAQNKCHCHRYNPRKYTVKEKCNQCLSTGTKRKIKHIQYPLHREEQCCDYNKRSPIISHDI